MNYVIINLKENGNFNCDDNKKLIFIEALKVDKNLKILDRFKAYITMAEQLPANVVNRTMITKKMLKNSKEEKAVILEFIKFCHNCNIITYDAKFKLSFLLKSLYKNKINEDFKFRYIDIKDILKTKEEQIGQLTLNNIKKYFNIEEKEELLIILKLMQIYLKDNFITNLKDLFLLQPSHGKVFRGLYYPKYVIDIKISNDKYAGYIVDYSSDRYISYYVFLKELNSEYFDINEINKLRRLGAKIIMNVSYFSELSLKFTDCYFILAADSTKVTSACNKLINGINNIVEYSKEKNIKLLLWGTIKELRNSYGIIDKDILVYFISLIGLVKAPWDYWSIEDLKYLASER